MSKANDNPFDNFPVDGSPLYFYERMSLALGWVAPHLQEDNDEHLNFLAYCRTYARMMHPEAPLLPGDTLPPEYLTNMLTATQIVLAQQKVVYGFEKVRSKILTDTALERSARLDQAQSDRAAKPRKLSPEQIVRINKIYWDAKREGGRRGVVKELSREFCVSVTHIQSIVRKLKPDNIDK